MHSNRKCAKCVEISDCKMDLTYSVGYSLVVNVQKDAFVFPAWRFVRLSKSVTTFRKMRFLKNSKKKKKVSSEIATFWVFFSLVHHTVHMHIMNWLKIWLKEDFFLKNAFLRFLPQKLSITK